MPAQQFSQLELLREAVADYLRGTDAFGGIAVATRKDGDIVNTIETNVGKTGVVAECYLKSAKPTMGQSYKVLFDPVILGLTIYENVLVNQDPRGGTGKGAFYLIESALVALKMWTPPEFSNSLFPDPAGFQYGRSPENPTWLILIHDFTTTLQLAARTT